MVLALAFEEPGWDRVPWGIDELLLPAVCLAEVVSKLVDRWGDDAPVTAFLEPLGLGVRAMTEKQALSAGLLRMATRRLGLSLSDRCCLVLAVELRAPVMTADRAWEALDLGVEVRLIR